MLLRPERWTRAVPFQTTAYSYGFIYTERNSGGTNVPFTLVKADIWQDEVEEGSEDGTEE